MGIVGAMCFLAFCVSHAEISNQNLRLEVGSSSEGVPSLVGLKIMDGRKSTLTGVDGLKWTDWIPSDLIPEGGIRPGEWTRRDAAPFLGLETERDLADGIRMTWRIEAASEGGLVRCRCRLENRGSVPRSIEWFPVWNGLWKAPGHVSGVRVWESLSFKAQDHDLSSGGSFEWLSRIHSSDEIDHGINPYWMFSGPKGHIFLALEWCGGWKAQVDGRKNVLGFHAKLPSDETQLILEPGEAIDGPAMHLWISSESDEARARAEWMRERAALAKVLYGGPEPAYPFAYNNWYTTRFDVDAAFLKRQVSLMDPYHFDAFIVDAGWYEAVGKWTPDPKKFAPGELESIMKAVKDKGTLPGIWSCPQFVKADKDNLPEEVDRPGMYRKFIDGWLLDMAGCGFDKFLAKHVADLRAQFGMEYWKYDQDFFTEKTRAGRMKNAVAFQNAMLAVRNANPDLVMENCQSGGRMTNEFTVLSTQSQWLKDGGRSGLGHARDNISVALGAMEFIFPWACNRWTNNFDQIDPADDELTRYYCRSAMAGTWGIVSDLAKIPQRQQKVILAEAANYRRLNAFKKDYLYDVYCGDAAKDFTGVVFYDTDRNAAAVLALRWDKKGAFEPAIPVRFLLADAAYCIEDVDTGKTESVAGKELLERGWQIPFGETRMSALVFVEPAPK